MKIINKNGKDKPYIYKSDIAEFLNCGHPDSVRIFEEVKSFELEVMGIEMFENRVPQDLFHEYRKKRKRRTTK